MDYVYCGNESGGRPDEILTLTSKNIQQISIQNDYSVYLSPTIYLPLLLLVYDAQNGNDAYPASNFTSFNMGETVPEYLEMGTILADGGDTFGVSSVQFDTHEELLWMGNEGVS